MSSLDYLPFYRVHCSNGVYTFEFKIFAFGGLHGEKTQYLVKRPRKCPDSRFVSHVCNYVDDVPSYLLSLGYTYFLFKPLYK